MKQLSRDFWLAIGLLIVLVIVTIAAAIQQNQEQIAPPLASFSSAPDGARALWLWLDELGYPVSDEVFGEFRPPDDTGLMLILEPTIIITGNEWETIDSWVEEGGTLVLAGEGARMLLAARHYAFDLGFLATPTDVMVTQSPLWTSPPAGPARVQSRAYFETERDDFATHLAVEAGPVLVSFEQGAGRVILSAAPFPFSNAGLKETGNPSMVLNILATTEQTGLIWFDEWHHGQRLNRTEVVGPGNWLRYTPAGHSFLYIAIVIFIAIALRGQRFGRPVPLPQDSARRGPLEHITAIANLKRRAGHRHAVLSQYHHWLKRSLGQRYRLNPTLPDEAYVTQLARLKPDLDAEALKSLLARLQQTKVSEIDMTQWAAEVAQWLKERP